MSLSDVEDSLICNLPIYHVTDQTILGLPTTSDNSFTRAKFLAGVSSDGGITDELEPGTLESIIINRTIIPDFYDVDRPIDIFVVATAVVGNKLLQAYRETDGTFVLIEDLQDMEPAFENVISTYDSSGNALVPIQIYSGPNPLGSSPISFFIGYRLSDLSGPFHYALPFTLN